jgi:predicted methyltransferase
VANAADEQDGPQPVSEPYDRLGPDGILAVVDHYAAAGAPRETGNTLHRMDPAIVTEELVAAGSELDAGSDVLGNTAKDHSLHMGEPQVHGKTDRFVVTCRKPGR